jgi:hypothetical protein
VENEEIVNIMLVEAAHRLSIKRIRDVGNPKAENGGLRQGTFHYERLKNVFRFVSADVFV